MHSVFKYGKVLLGIFSRAVRSARSLKIVMVTVAAWFLDWSTVSSMMTISPAAAQGLDACQKAASTCSTDPEAPLVAYVSKMVAIPASALPRTPGGTHTPEGAT